jgi:hypothetical protein
MARYSHWARFDEQPETRRTALATGMCRATRLGWLNLGSILRSRSGPSPVLSKAGWNRQALLSMLTLPVARQALASSKRRHGRTMSDQRRQLDLEYQDWARLQGRGPHTAGGHWHGRNRHVGWQEQ